MTLLEVRLVGGLADGCLQAQAPNIFGQPPAAIAAVQPDGMLSDIASVRVKGMDMPHERVAVARSDYFYTGASDMDKRPLYVHQSLNSWWGAPNDAERPEDPWPSRGGWQWVRYVGGDLDGTLDRLPVLFTRWHDWRTTRHRDPHGVMIYLWTGLKTWQ